MQDKIIKNLIDTIQASVDSFNKNIPGIQQQIFDDILSLTKELELSNGKIKNNVNNLKLILKIKSKLQRIILSKEYKDNIKKFIESYTQVDGLHNQYFAAYQKKKTTNQVEKLNLIKESSITQTVYSLTESGLNINLIDPVESILRQNITSGASYADMQSQIRTAILSDGNNLGGLERYTKQITTDAINQYSRQYMQTVASDLKFEWYVFIGSEKTTTREWCHVMVAKKYVHISELDTIVKGIVDGHKCAIYKKTDLPFGMIPGTNAQSLLVNAGGYNCEHHFYPIPASEVPKEVIDKFKNKGKKPEPVQQPEPAKKPKQKPISDKIDLSAAKPVKTLKDAEKLLLENKTQISSWFNNTEFKSLGITYKANSNAQTDLDGNIWLSPSKANYFIQALQKIQNGLDLSVNEEKSFATMWHEIWHNRNQSEQAPFMTNSETKYMELGNEFVARKTLDEFFDKFGVTLKNKSLKNDRDDTGYNTMVKNYDRLIEHFKVDPEKVLAYLSDKMTNGDYTEVKKYLIEAILSENKDLKKKDVSMGVTNAARLRNTSFNQLYAIR